MDGRVRITARLVEAASDQHVWARSYERNHRDILDLQNEVTRDIAENVARVGMGNTEDVFAVFERAYLEHSTALPSLRVNPLYDSMRDDPRFDRLMLRIGLRA